MEKKDLLDGLKLLVVCMFWYSCSASGNVIGKMVLNEFPYPMTMTMVQLASGALYLGPILSLFNIPTTGEISRRYYMVMVIPLALGKFVSSVSSHISIWKVSVSYAHTVKATLPLFTVILLRLVFKEKQTYLVYLSLLPIIGGVCVATVTEISFDIIGLLSALFATLGFSLQTIFSKKTLADTGVHQMNLLLILSRLSALLFIPFWLVIDVRRIVYDENVIQNENKITALVLILLDGLFNMLQNIFAFTVLAMVNPLSYAVANATKRVVIIGASLLILHNPVTYTNVFGMFVAIFGVLLYNSAKLKQKRAELRKKTLPLIHSDSDLQVHIPNKQGLTHSATETNFQANGFVQDNFLFQNPDTVEQVTLIPVAHTDYQKKSAVDFPKELHSRMYSVHGAYEV